jgi:hypothetical protein
MALELSLGYFYGSGNFDYNYLVGCAVGLSGVYILDYTVVKVKSVKEEETTAV